MEIISYIVSHKAHALSIRSHLQVAGLNGLIIGSLLIGLSASALAQHSFLDEFDNPSPIEGVIPWKTTDVHIHPNLKGKTYTSTDGFVITSTGVFNAYKNKNNNFSSLRKRNLPLEREDHSPIYFKDKDGKAYIALIDLPTLIFQIEPLNLPELRALLKTQRDATPFEQRHAALKAISPGFGLAFQRGEWGKWSVKTSFGIKDFPWAINSHLYPLELMADKNHQTQAKDDPNSAAFLRTKATKLEKKGKLEDAQQLREKALELQEQIFGAQDIVIATGLEKLGRNLYAQKKYDEATPFLQRALDIREQKSGADSLSTADALLQLAKTLHASKQFEQATPLYQRALNIHEKKLSKTSIKKAVSLNYLAVNLYAQRKFDEAAPLFQRAFDIRKRTSGIEDTKTKIALKNLVNTYNALAFGFKQKDKHTKAEPYFRKVLQLRLKQKEAEILKAIAYHNLSDNLFWQGKTAQAQSQSDQALSIMQAIQNDHQNVGIFLRVRARIQNAQDDIENARKSAENAISILTRTLGKDHPKTLDALSILAEIKKRSQ